jgi:hypothetical protein
LHLYCTFIAPLLHLASLWRSYEEKEKEKINRTSLRLALILKFMSVVLATRG